MNFELRQLKHFEALSRHQSFRRAAEEQYITQSALTRSIQHLEEGLEVRLFDRTTRTVELTDAGRHLLASTERLLSQAHELEREALMLRGVETGEVKVGSGPLPTASLVGPAINIFVKKHPNIQIDVQTSAPEQALEALLDARLDLVLFDVSLFETSRFRSELDVELLPPEPMVVVLRAGHPLNRTSATLHDLLQFPWASPHLTPHFARHLPAEIQSLQQQRPLLQYRFASLSACLRLAETSDVLTVAPQSVAMRILREGLLVMRPFPFPLSTVIGVHTVRRRTLSPASLSLIEALRDVATAASLVPSPVDLLPAL